MVLASSPYLVFLLVLFTENLFLVAIPGVLLITYLTVTDFKADLLFAFILHSTFHGDIPSQWIRDRFTYRASYCRVNAGLFTIYS